MVKRGFVLSPLLVAGSELARDDTRRRRPPLRPAEHRSGAPSRRQQTAGRLGPGGGTANWIIPDPAGSSQFRPVRQAFHFPSLLAFCISFGGSCHASRGKNGQPRSLYSLFQLQGCVSRSDSPADCVVDGARIGDVPARYVVRGLQGHELPVVGTYVDPNIVTGFCYQVRPVDAKKALFQVGPSPGYRMGTERITFASDKHNINDNYFWSDTHPEGYGFALRLVQEGDKFTLRDANGYSVATAEVIGLLGPQTEVSHRVLENGGIEKRAQVSVLCNVSYFDEPHAELRPVAISGVAVSLRAKGARAVASLKKIKECSVGGERGYTLVAGVDSSSRVTMLSGDKIGDVPTKYYVTGLLPHEQPVAGTFGIGRGYGKRLTFASTSLNNNENYFWSDSHPEGYGFSIQAVVPGDSFRIMSSSGEEVGRAQVFRADLPQVEESSTVSSEGHVTKRVRVTVTCDVTFHGEDDRTLAVTGTAVVVRRGRVARALRLEDVAIGSQISVLFSRASETLTFVRE
ncbi:hypothetical protein C7M84_012510 [Penaeus vannamei]|uniref:Uncharacterized protein n=1 Tax=Penaeus vannamei TaxID=6689 RepID=A0A423SYD7_PENVA|nr:hypothetical protein C7M84_012510 [Penaeus vannamei]